MSGARIVVIGNANVDLTTYVPRTPEAGETILGSDFSIGMGGKGANQAVAAARAGSRVAFIGRIGRDAFGEMVHSALGDEGLDLTELASVDGPSGVASIYVEDSGENRIAVFPGASRSLSADDARAAVLRQSDARTLVAQLEIDQSVVVAALHAASSHAMVTILNIAPYASLLPGILANTTWLIANEGELAALLEDNGLDTSDVASPASLATQLPAWVEKLGCNLVVTLGSEGAIGCVGGEEPFAHKPPKVSALDTVGAGDCFVGFFASFLDAGLSWQQALSGAVTAASDTVTRAGAQSSYPSKDEARAYKAEAEKA